jgi:hypothetical protein
MTSFLRPRLGPLGGLLALAASTAACASPDASTDGAATDALAGDCDESDAAGQLPQAASERTLFDLHLSYRQTDDAGQSIAEACDLTSHLVTAQGMRDVPLHCSGRSQAESGYERVAARWGTSLGGEACGRDFCAALYTTDGEGALREIAREVFVKDRFFCSQVEERVPERLDVDACTYADVVGALKGTAPTADDSNLRFDARWKLTGYEPTGLSLKYRLYPCGEAPEGPAPRGEAPARAR